MNKETITTIQNSQPHIMSLSIEATLNEIKQLLELQNEKLHLLNEMMHANQKKETIVSETKEIKTNIRSKLFSSIFVFITSLIVIHFILFQYFGIKMDNIHILRQWNLFRTYFIEFQTYIYSFLLLFNIK